MNRLKINVVTLKEDEYLIRDSIRFENCSYLQLFINDEVWDKAKYSIVLNGNYYKFTQNKEMMDFLLSTGDKILVEASPMDTIWGIGLSKDNEKAQNIAAWRGKNLLGFALMEVRDEIRKLYQNVHLLKE